MHSEVMKSRAHDLEFLAINEQVWGNAFVASEAMYLMILDITGHCLKYANTLSQEERLEKYFTFTTIQQPHARAMQQFLEIITLMRNGFTDCAYARWRSLYEISVIASFIVNQGEKVAEAFIDSIATEKQYEWAKSSGLFSKSKRVTFNDIRKHSDIQSSLYDQYSLASKLIHASSDGTFSRFGSPNDSEDILIGRSDYGITTPAEHSAISLVQITSILLEIFPSDLNSVSEKYIVNWIQVIRESYFKIHDEAFPKEEKLWKDGMVSFLNNEFEKAEEE